jgi:hypothetical protein
MTQTNDSLSPIDALKAIKARVAGEFDNPLLAAVGPLFPDALQDIVRIADQAIAGAQEPSAGTPSASSDLTTLVTDLANALEVTVGWINDLVDLKDLEQGEVDELEAYEALYKRAKAPGLAADAAST